MLRRKVLRVIVSRPTEQQMIDDNMMRSPPQFKKTGFQFLLATIIAIGLLAAPTIARAFDDDQTTEIEQIVRSYLLDHPEILPEMLERLDLKETAETEAAAKQEMATNSDKLRNPGDAFVAGNPEGDVTLIEFFDYTCGFCRRALPDMQRILSEDKNLRVVYIDFPALANRNPVSMVASRASVAAANQNKYVAFHNKLMSASSALSEGSILATAKEVGLDMDQLVADMQSAETEAWIDANMAMAHRMKINGTPTFIIGDTVLPGAVGYQLMIAAIAKERAKAD